MSLFRLSADRLKPMLKVRSEYLDEILDKIFNTYGTVEEYFKNTCEINYSSVEKLRNLITE